MDEPQASTSGVSGFAQASTSFWNRVEDGTQLVGLRTSGSLGVRFSGRHCVAFKDLPRWHRVCEFQPVV